VSRRIQLKENDEIERCPKCDNNTEFIAYSKQVAEDVCNVWMVCKCGYDPTAENTLLRYEDVWGGVDKENCLMALECWNDAINQI